MHDNICSQFNFCSLAGQAETLLKKIQKEGDPPPKKHNLEVIWHPEILIHTARFVFVVQMPDCHCCCQQCENPNFKKINFLSVSSEAETNVSSVQADQEQDDECSGDEDSGCENSPDQGDIMGFSAEAIAEQLTRMDSVRERRGSYLQYIKCLYVPHLHMSTVLQ